MKKPTVFAERLAALMAKREMSQYTLAGKSGVPQPTIQRILSGETQNPKIETLRNLAKVLGARESLEEYQAIAGTTDTGYAVNVKPASSTRIQYPLISWVQAGVWSEIVDAYPRGDGEGALFAQNQHGQHTFALRIVGDSMEPEFREGDVIFVDPDVGPKAGSYVVAKNNEEEATFKKYRSRGKDAEGNEVFELVPLNENYATLRSDQEPIVIIGVVVEHTRVFKV